MSTINIDEKTNTHQDKNFFKNVVDQTSSIGAEINSALKSIKETNGKTHMLSTTAKIEANRTGDVGRNFLVVSNSIDELSSKTDDVIDEMQLETIQEIESLSSIIESKSISIQGNRLCDLALTNIRLIDRNLFERSADIRWWATDDILIKSLEENSEVSYGNAENRLAEILKSYTVYYDLILCDTQGNCLATGENKFGLKGKNFSDKTWFKKAIETSDGSEYGFQTVHHSPRINDDYTIVYSCKIHEDGNTSRKAIGILAAVFKWKTLAQRIVNETALSDEEKTKTRVLISDRSGNVLADTKEKILGEKIQFNGRDELFSKDKGFTVIKKNERFQLVCHALSPGFEGYCSKEWHSLVIMELDISSSNGNFSDTSGDDSLDTVVELVQNLSVETKKATLEIEKINDQTQVLALNAAIEASRVGDAGRGFSVISGFMGDLSKQTSDITKSMNSKTQEKINKLNDFLSSNSKRIKGERLSNLSFTNIDLVDRALYERTADVRWWATEPSLVKTLDAKTEENTNFLINRLHTILQYYTVYEDIIVTDNNGNIIANGSDENFKNKNISNLEWYQNAKKIVNGDSYSFDVIKKQEDHTEKFSLIFSCKVHKNGDSSRESIGVLGVVFNWEQFSKVIFEETPLSNVEKNTTTLLITDSNGDELAVSNKNKTLSKSTVKPLMKKTKNFDFIKENNLQFLSGHATSTGFEGFSTGWHAFIIQSEVK